MKPIAAICAFAMLLAMTGASAGAAEQLVQIAPTRSGLGDTRSDQPLLGYLVTPPGAGRHPAVVVLHGCEGFTLRYVITGHAVQSWGYAALVLDSLGDANACHGGQGAMAEALDAYAALHWLAAQPFIDPARVALLGFSMGGLATLEAAQQGALADTFPDHFHAAAAYYPPCRWSSGIMTMPTLILIGSTDDWSPATDCQAMLTRRADQGAPVTLQVFPGATHAFDSPAPPHVYLGHAIQFDPAASVAAREQTHSFLRQWLDSQPPMSH